MTPSNDIGIGIIGLGMGAVRCKELMSVAGARLAAVSDVDEGRGERARDEYGCLYFHDFNEMITCSEVDVVYVMTPSGMHAEMGIAAAQAGKTVIIAKPIEVTLEAADRLIAACDQAGVPLMLEFDNRYNPEFIRVKHAMDSGAFGKPIFGEARLKWWRGAAYFEGWHGTWAMDGGGSLINQTVHYVDLLQWIMGPVTEVSGQFGVFAHDIETEDLCQAQLRFESGALGSLLGTTTYSVNEYTQFEVHGDCGGASVVNHKISKWEVKKEFEDRDGIRDASAFDFEYDGPKNVLEDVVLVLNDGKLPACDGAAGRKSLELVTAVYDSCRRNAEWVSLA